MRFAHVEPINQWQPRLRQAQINEKAPSEERVVVGRATFRCVRLALFNGELLLLPLLEGVLGSCLKSIGVQLHLRIPCFLLCVDDAY